MSPVSSIGQETYLRLTLYKKPPLKAKNNNEKW